jgi:hypothetical protein
MPKEQALYVIVRKKLSKSSPAVQAGHAAVKFVFEHGHKIAWRNGTLVYLAVSDQKQLMQEKEKLEGKLFTEFEEPDLGGEVTAIAVLGDESARLSEFSHLPLL